MRLLYHLPDRDISLPWIYTFRGAKVHTIFQLTKWAGGAFRGGEQSPQIRILYTKSARKLAENCQNLVFR